MGLKQFHIIFMVASILVSGFFGYWAFQMYTKEHSFGYLATAISSFICAGALGVYSVCYVRKIKA